MDEFFSRLPPVIQWAMMIGTLLAFAFGGYGAFRKRRQFVDQGSAADPASNIMSNANRIERANNDRFDRLDRGQADLETEMRDGFRRIERGLADISKDVLAIRQRRRR